MKPIRFSVATFLMFVAAVAAAFGALESNSYLMGSLVFSLNLALLSFALVGAIVAGGVPRVFWIGFVVFGGLYSLVAFGFLFPSTGGYPNNNVAGSARTNDRPQLITSRLLDLYASLRAPRAVGDRVSAQWSGGGLWPATIVEYKDGRYQVDWDDSSPNEWVTNSQIQPVSGNFERVGHSVFSLLLGFIGGVAAVCLFSQRAAKPAAPASVDTKPPPSPDVASA